MTFNISPSVKVTEFDFSLTSEQVQSSLTGMAIQSTRGEAYTIVPINNERQLVQTFNRPTDRNYDSWFPAYKFLEYASSLRLVRPVIRKDTIQNGLTGHRIDGTKPTINAQVGIFQDDNRKYPNVYFEALYGIAPDGRLRTNEVVVGENFSIAPRLSFFELAGDTEFTLHRDSSAREESKGDDPEVAPTDIIKMITKTISAEGNLSDGSFQTDLKDKIYHVGYTAKNSRLFRKLFKVRFSSDNSVYLFPITNNTVKEEFFDSFRDNIIIGSGNSTNMVLQLRSETDIPNQLLLEKFWVMGGEGESPSKSNIRYPFLSLVDVSFTNPVTSGVERGDIFRLSSFDGPSTYTDRDVFGMVVDLKDSADIVRLLVFQNKEYMVDGAEVDVSGDSMGFPALPGDIDNTIITTWQNDASGSYWLYQTATWKYLTDGLNTYYTEDGIKRTDSWETLQSDSDGGDYESYDPPLLAGGNYPVITFKKDDDTTDYTDHPGIYFSPELTGQITNIEDPANSILEAKIFSPNEPSFVFDEEGIKETDGRIIEAFDWFYDNDLPVTETTIPEDITSFNQELLKSAEIILKITPTMVGFDPEEFSYDILVQNPHEYVPVYPKVNNEFPFVERETIDEFTGQSTFEEDVTRSQELQIFNKDVFDDMYEGIQFEQPNEALRFISRWPGSEGNNVWIATCTKSTFEKASIYEGLMFRDLFEYAPASWDEVFVVVIFEEEGTLSVVENWQTSLKPERKNSIGEPMFIEKVINENSSYVYCVANTTLLDTQEWYIIPETKAIDKTKNPNIGRMPYEMNSITHYYNRVEGLFRRLPKLVDLEPSLDFTCDSTSRVVYLSFELNNPNNALTDDKISDSSPEIVWDSPTSLDGYLVGKVVEFKSPDEDGHPNTDSDTYLDNMFDVPTREQETVEAFPSFQYIITRIDVQRDGDLAIYGKRTNLEPDGTNIFDSLEDPISAESADNNPEIAIYLIPFENDLYSYFNKIKYIVNNEDDFDQNNATLPEYIKFETELENYNRRAVDLPAPIHPDGYSGNIQFFILKYASGYEYFPYTIKKDPNGIIYPQESTTRTRMWVDKYQKGDEVQLVDNVISGPYTSNDQWPGYIREIDGYYPASDSFFSSVTTLFGGHDGVNKDGVIGRPSDADVLQAFDLFSDPEETDINLLCSGGFAGQPVALHLTNICERRRDCICILNTPSSTVKNKTKRKATDASVQYRNGDSGYGSISSTYSFLISQIGYIFDKFNDEYRWIDLTGDIAGLAARTDQNFDPWWTFAGYRRGRLTDIARLAYNPNLELRNELVKSQINPIFSSPGDGIVLFHEKMMTKQATVFGECHIRRLFITLEKAISNQAKYFIMEFNDQFTRNQFRQLVEPYLQSIKAGRGIEDFMVICDESNNTAETRRKRQMFCDIYIIPTGAIYYIGLNIIAVKEGVSFSEVNLNQ